jgi:hypothetical protein
MTYTGQGVNKKGVKAKYHAVIYTGKKPVTFEGEKSKGLKMSPIKMIPISSRHKLDSASRLNYAKQYTVEHNVKVWFVGEVAQESEAQLVEDYNKTNPPMEMRKERHKGKIIEEEEEYYEDQTSSQSHSAYPSTAPTPYSAYPATSSYTQQAGGYSYASSSSTPYKTSNHAGYDQQDPAASYFGQQSYQQPSTGSYPAHQEESQPSGAVPGSAASQHTMPEDEARVEHHSVEHDASVPKGDAYDPEDTHPRE